MQQQRYRGIHSSIKVLLVGGPGHGTIRYARADKIVVADPTWIPGPNAYREALPGSVLYCASTWRQGDHEFVVMTVDGAEVSCDEVIDAFAVTCGLRRRVVTDVELPGGDTS